MVLQKEINMRNPKYLTWIRNLPCAACSSPSRNEAHHIRGIGHFGGVGRKASDYLTMPLCGLCHDRIHNVPELKELQLFYLLDTLAKAIRFRIIEIETSYLLEIINGIDAHIRTHAGIHPGEEAGGDD